MGGLAYVVCRTHLWPTLCATHTFGLHCVPHTPLAYIVCHTHLWPTLCATHTFGLHCVPHTHLHLDLLSKGEGPQAAQAVVFLGSGAPGSASQRGCQIKRVTHARARARARAQRRCASERGHMAVCKRSEDVFCARAYVHGHALARSRRASEHVCTWRTCAPGRLQRAAPPSCTRTADAAPPLAGRTLAHMLTHVPLHLTPPTHTHSQHRYRYTSTCALPWLALPALLPPPSWLYLAGRTHSLLGVRALACTAGSWGPCMCTAGSQGARAAAHLPGAALQTLQDHHLHSPRLRWRLPCKELQGFLELLAHVQPAAAASIILLLWLLLWLRRRWRQLCMQGGSERNTERDPLVQPHIRSASAAPWNRQWWGAAPWNQQ